MQGKDMQSPRLKDNLAQEPRLMVDAIYELAQSLGLMHRGVNKDTDIYDVLWNSNFVSDGLRNILDKLVECSVLIDNGGYSWNPNIASDWPHYDHDATPLTLRQLMLADFKLGNIFMPQHEDEIVRFFIAQAIGVIGTAETPNERVYAFLRGSNPIAEALRDIMAEVAAIGMIRKVTQPGAYLGPAHDLWEWDITWHGWWRNEDPSLAYAPFTDDEIKSFNAYQTEAYWHNLTCGSQEKHEQKETVYKAADGKQIPVTVPYGENALVAAADGLHCPTCDYVQKTTPKFTVNWAWRVVNDTVESIRNLGEKTQEAKAVG
jgi:hypothetical protein